MNALLQAKLKQREQRAGGGGEASNADELPEDWNGACLRGDGEEIAELIGKLGSNKVKIEALQKLLALAGNHLGELVKLKEVQELASQVEDEGVQQQFEVAQWNMALTKGDKDEAARLAKNMVARDQQRINTAGIALFEKAGEHRDSLLLLPEVEALACQTHRGLRYLLRNTDISKYTPSRAVEESPVLKALFPKFSERAIYDLARLIVEKDQPQEFDKLIALVPNHREYVVTHKDAAGCTLLVYSGKMTHVTFGGHKDALNPTFIIASVNI